MTAPCSVLVSLEDKPYYHVYSRVVRRAWLCGEDAFSGKNFDHRRGWIAERIAQLAAMAYVDLNSIRAGMAETPETSDYTSIQERLETLPEGQATEKDALQPKPPADAPAEALEGEALQPEPKVASLARAPLMPFDAAAQTPWAIPFAFDDYVELVEWTGRACVSGKTRTDSPGEAENPRPPRY